MKWYAAPNNFQKIATAVKIGCFTLNKTIAIHRLYAENNERYNELWYSPGGASAIVFIRFGNFTSSTLQITNFVGYG